MKHLLRHLIFLLAAFCSVGLAQPAFAQLSFSLKTGADGATASALKTQEMVFDSNQCVGGSGPHAMYVGGRVTNTGSTIARNVTASIAGLSGGFYLAGGQATSLDLGAISPGQSAGAYWFVGYGCTETSTAPIITVTSSAGTTTANLSLTGKKSISANATGFLDSTTLGPGAVVGQVINLDVQYSFGQSSAADTVYFQPSGLAEFNAGCFRLSSTSILSSNLPGVSAGVTNQLFFKLGLDGNKSTVTVRYWFVYECEGASTTARPYAMGLSGQQLKYTGNYDTAATAFTISFPGATNPFTITKTSDKTSALTGTATDVLYTVTISNPSAIATTITKFVDTLPAGAVFKSIDATSDVKISNSSSYPVAGATGQITFQGVQDQSYAIAAYGSTKLVYTVTIPGTAGTYTNSAKGQFGQAATPVASTSFTVGAASVLVVSKSSAPISDPYNGTTEPKLIPGSEVAYTIQVANGAGNSNINTVVIVDPTPTGLDFAAGSPPVVFTGGNSNLLFTYTSLASQTDDIDFSNNGGSTWTYVPSPDSSGKDPNVTHVRIRPRGTMASASNFNVVLKYRVE